jgi:hypothetical protein
MQHATADGLAQAFAREISLGSPESSAKVIMLDDVSPR